jgi:maleylacetoacetate isomerase
MTIRLYSYWRSSAAYRVRIALNLKELDYDIVPVSLAPDVSEHRQAPYRQLNPQMLVPFFEDGDVAIGQSMAILEYLEEAYPAVTLLPPGHPLRSEVRAFCNIIACDIHPLNNLRVMNFIRNKFGGDPTAETRPPNGIRTGFRKASAPPKRSRATTLSFSAMRRHSRTCCLCRRCTMRGDSTSCWMRFQSWLRSLAAATNCRHS